MMHSAGVVFVDSVGWIALVHRADELHEKAVRAYRGQGHERRLTTDAVLIESCNAFSKETLRPLAHALMDKVRVTKTLGILEVVGAWRQGLEPYRLHQFRCHEGTRRRQGADLRPPLHAGRL